MSVLVLIFHTSSSHVLNLHTYFNVETLLHFGCVIYLLFTGIVLFLLGASALMDIYKQEVRCKWQLPQLQRMDDEKNSKQKLLIRLRETIHLAWDSR